MGNLRDELQKIYEARSQLTATDVVEVAADPEHPLHSHFEWNDKIAGPKYRKEQARRLIRSCRVTQITTDEGTPNVRVRAFHHVPRTDGVPTYQPSEEIALDPVARSIVMREMQRRWKDMRATYGHFQEFVQMVHDDLPAMEETG